MLDRRPLPHAGLERWIFEVAGHTLPAHIHVCDGSDGAYATIVADGVRRGELRESERDGWEERGPESVGASVIHDEYVSTSSPGEVGPTNRWLGRDAAEDRVWSAMRGCMAGRTMYVVPYLLGPPGGYVSRAGVQITDSPYAAATLSRLVRVGRPAREVLGGSTFFTRAVHSRAPVGPERACVVHFPETQEIWSVGSDAPRASLLARTGHGLRLASYQAHAEGWLVARASLLALAPPGRPKHYVAVVAPDVSGAHELAEVPRGWSVERTEPTACFFYVGRDGRMWAFSTERGRSGYRVRTREVALSGLVFATARSPSGPRVTEARSWRHGVYVGASLVRDAGAGSAVHDPFGMADDCGIGIGDYVEDWLTIGRQLTVPLRVFTVDLARPLGDGELTSSCWLPWIHARLENAVGAVATPIGFAPSVGWIERAGIGAPRHALERLCALDLGALLADAERAGAFFARLGNQLSTALHVEQRELSKRLQSSIH